MEFDLTEQYDGYEYDESDRLEAQEEMFAEDPYPWEYSPEEYEPSPYDGTYSEM